MKGFVLASVIYLYIVDSGIPPHAASTIDAFDFTGTGPYDCPNGHGTRMIETVMDGGLQFQPIRTTMLKAFTCTGVVQNDTLPKIALYLKEQPIGLVVFAVSNSRITNHVDDFVNDVIRTGHIIVSAAGNWGKDACTTSPAHVRSGSHIVVGATDSFISNKGDCVNVTTASNQGTSIAAAKIARMILACASTLAFDASQVIAGADTAEWNTP
jgi:hypothetical protein